MRRAPAWRGATSTSMVGSESEHEESGSEEEESEEESEEEVDEGADAAGEEDGEGVLRFVAATREAVSDRHLNMRVGGGAAAMCAHGGHVEASLHILK